MNITGSFPIGSQTVQKTVLDTNPNTQSTTTLIASNIVPQRIDVFGVQIIPSSFGRIRVVCNDSYTVADNFINGRSFDFSFLELKNNECQVPVEIELTNGTLSIGTFGGGMVSLTYRNRASSTMATTTFSEVCGNAGDVYVCYNPFISLLGISFLAGLFFLATFAVIRIFKRW